MMMTPGPRAARGSPARQDAPPEPPRRTPRADDAVPRTCRRIESQLENWDAAAKAGLEALGAASRLALLRSHLIVAEAQPDIDVAHAKLEERMATAHLALEAALRGMRSAVGVLAQMTAERASGADRRGGDTDDDEVNMILDVAAEVAVMLALQLGSAAKVVDDVLWCDAHDTHTLYSAVWLMQPYVDEGTVARLQELCDYHRPPPVVEGGVIKSL